MVPNFSMLKGCTSSESHRSELVEPLILQLLPGFHVHGRSTSELIDLSFQKKSSVVEHVECEKLIADAVECWDKWSR